MDVKQGLDKLKNIVGATAPLLASVIGSNYYGIALSILAKFLGTGDNVTDIISKISSTPDMALKLKQLENEHAEVLKKLANDEFAHEVDDRKDARLREKELHDFVPTVLALGFLVIYAFFQFYVINKTQTASNDIISARFQDGLMYILAYYFGGMHKKRDDQP
jgi:hypothetical protein